MSAALDDMSVVQYKDLIGVADGFQTVGNHDDGLVMGQCLDSPLQFILILRVMLPYKSLCFTSIKDRHGVYAMINKDERRDVSIRKPRPSIRKQLADSKQATSPKKAAARTKKNELEV